MGARTPAHSRTLRSSSTTTPSTTARRSNPSSANRASSPTSSTTSAPSTASSSSALARDHHLAGDDLASGPDAEKIDAAGERGGTLAKAVKDELGCAGAAVTHVHGTHAVAGHVEHLGLHGGFLVERQVEGGRTRERIGVILAQHHQTGRRTVHAARRCSRTGEPRRVDVAFDVAAEILPRENGSATGNGCQSG